jgi:hypothetical protein
MLFGADLWWVLQSPHQRLAILWDSSTDLSHLRHVPWLVLPASSLWSGHLIAYWAVVTLLCLGALELVRGPVVTLVTGLAAHVIGTVVSEGILAIRIGLGAVSSSATHLLDVGPSYIVASCAAAVVASSRAPRLVRIGCAVTLIPLLVSAFDVDDAGQVASVGHGVAILIGIAVARLPVRRPVAVAV